MTQLTTSSHHQLVSFPAHLLTIAKHRAKSMGFSFSDYVKHLIINDNKNTVDAREEWLTEEQETSLAKAMEDIKAGRVGEIKDIHEFVQSLGR